ncbi:uncharacterized protein LOC114943271 [Nylanderia fulva]|uniref:uncharacterized protein LOC114943271 n=1 Tax=Nylanderia fulva TaxID=613905 RepID=UPI0010FAE794|nr:uncharacterized protein LOC114943271 [Nylanderia fulva]
MPAIPAVLLATARVRVHSAHGRFVPARALIDPGSAVTLITENLAQLLRLPRVKQNLSVTGVGQTKTSARYAANIKISPAKSNNPAYSTTALILCSLAEYVPPPVACHTQWTHLDALELADPDFLSPTPIDIIFGADMYGNIHRDGSHKGTPHEPFAQNTAFGWILSGPTVETCPRSSVPAYHTNISPNFEHILKQFWELEDIPARVHPSLEDTQCEEHFMTIHYRTMEGRYVVRLPFRNGPPRDLGDSRVAALKSLERLERRFRTDPSLATEYTAFLTEYANLGHMTKIKPTEFPAQAPAYYIPHRAVIREHSNTTRLRVVFNASCNTATSKSLNSALHVGAKLQTDLVAVVLQWRQPRFALSADIAKMYRQILVHPLDTKYQCLLWRSSPTAQVDEYRLLTVTYGTAAAPFLALRVLRQLAEDEGSQFPLAVPVLLQQTYVDDCTFGADDLETAKQTRDQLISLLSRGCFRLRKWASNCPTLFEDLDPSDHGLATNKDLHDHDSIKILGVTWKPEHDIFTFQVLNSITVTKTKRGILSVIAQLFDPLGWVAPVIVTAKIFLQHLWLTKSDWDDELPNEMLSKWETFQLTLPLLEQLTIPHWTQYHPNNRIELHGFADASTRAYAAALYLRVISGDGCITNTLILAKSKVAPLKTISVPRLELCAALLLAQLMDFARSALHLPDIDYWCWSDSMVVLAWIRQSPSRWKTFVANRVSKMQQLLPNGK